MPGDSHSPYLRPSLGARTISGSFHLVRRTKSHGGDSDDEPVKEVAHVQFFLDNHLPATYFKQDILKLIHTLKIPRWKYVSEEMAEEIILDRLSGAMTNAIYAVSPPIGLREIIKKDHLEQQQTNPNAFMGRSYHYRVPPKLLLRVYGPNVSHLIDRDKELAVLARLSEKNIGPKLFGTFQNGRFEQFLNAKALTKEDLRIPEISIQIAKRMRELHDGVPLLDRERSDGPQCFINIDTWKQKAIENLKLLDSMPDDLNPHRSVSILQSTIDGFFTAINNYKEFLYSKYGLEAIKKQLVFAHNDTQYGNILRIEPPKGSPLLMPQYEHRQLVVIDFEYSAANIRGYDIANHFCEWMSDYHDPERPYHIDHEKFPSRKEQLNLISSYVEHGYPNFDDEDAMTKDVEELIEQSVYWRPVVHAHWCIWGIVQAVIDDTTAEKAREDIDEASGLYKFQTAPATPTGTSPASSTLKDVRSALSLPAKNENLTIEEEDEEEEDDFDYLSYSTEKAQLFWSDLISLGFISKDDYKGKLKTIVSK